MPRKRERARASAGMEAWRPVERDPQVVVACADVRRGPHNRCAHPTAAPAGYRRCVGDQACPVWLRTSSLHVCCYEHRRLELPNHAYRELMGATDVARVVMGAP